MNTNKAPSFFDITKTDIPMFLFSILGFIFGPALIILGIVHEWPLPHNDNYMTIKILGATVGLILFVDLALMWWYFVIKNTFLKGIYIPGKVVDCEMFVGPYFRATFAFEHNNKEHTTYVAFINNKKNRNIIQNGTATVIAHPKKKIYFIKEAYL